MISYERREACKRQAWSILSDPNASVNLQASQAIHGLIAAHYWRAREALERSPAAFRRKVFGRNYSRWHELDIDVYTRHWLWANGERCLPAGVVDEIAECWYYEPQQHKLLPKGASMYGERRA